MLLSREPGVKIGILGIKREILGGKREIMREKKGTIGLSIGRGNEIISCLRDRDRDNTLYLPDREKVLTNQQTDRENVTTRFDRGRK